MYTKISSKELKNDSLCLLREYQESASLELRNQIVQLNIGLVRKEAHQWLNHSTENYEDLVQVGCIGLIRAIERFEMSKGNAFSSFAMPYIRGEIQHYLRDKSSTVRIPRRWKGLQKQAVSVKRDLQEKLHRKPTEVEIAEALEISAEEWSEIKLAKQNQTPLSLDAPVGEEGEKVTCLGELVPDTGYRSFQLAQEDQMRIRQALVQLEDRTRDVLEFVFLQDLTQKETAERMGISAVTVSRRVKKGLELLKKLMEGTE